MKITKKAENNHELFDALYDAYKWSNRVNEKILRVEDIRMGTCEQLHFSLEEEVQELRSLLKKASGKVLYLHHLTQNSLLSRKYNRDNLNEMADMISDFIDLVNDEISEININNIA